MPKGKKVSDQRAKEIQKEKIERVKELQNVTIEDFESESITERDYAKQFKTLYHIVRKGLVFLQQKRILKMMSNEEALLEAKQLLIKYSE